MLQVTCRRKRAFVWKSKQNPCCNELLNAYQLAMTRRMDCNHTDKYQVSLYLYFEPPITWICVLIHFEFEPWKCVKSSAKTFWKDQYKCIGKIPINCLAKHTPGVIKQRKLTIISCFALIWYLLSSSRTSVRMKLGLFNAKIRNENRRYSHRLIYQLNEQDLLCHSI